MSDAARFGRQRPASIAHIGTIVSTSSIAMAEQTAADGPRRARKPWCTVRDRGRIDEGSPRGAASAASTARSPRSRRRGRAGTLLKLTQGQMTQAIALAATSIGA